MSFTSNSPDETATFAVQLGKDLTAGDTVLLEGEIGAGKSHFARALIQSRLCQPEDVPSPTFTLVQMYNVPMCEIWHADLYRVPEPDQVIELGLLEAFESAICLVEWPDRLGDLRPMGGLTIRLEVKDDNDSRLITLLWTDKRWQDLIAQVLT